MKLSDDKIIFIQSFSADSKAITNELKGFSAFYNLIFNSQKSKKFKNIVEGSSWFNDSCFSKFNTLQINSIISWNSGW